MVSCYWEMRLNSNDCLAQRTTSLLFYLHIKEIEGILKELLETLIQKHWGTTTKRIWLVPDNRKTSCE
eukprot:m.5706 g.5706  ORF g.5706 m.5706 type:complete len:68 (-) comp3365_c0_seq2:28-231(-)